MQPCRRRRKRVTEPPLRQRFTTAFARRPIPCFDDCLEPGRKQDPETADSSGVKALPSVVLLLFAACASGPRPTGLDDVGAWAMQLQRLDRSTSIDRAREFGVRPARPRPGPHRARHGALRHAVDRGAARTAEALSRVLQRRPGRAVPQLLAQGVAGADEPRGRRPRPSCWPPTPMDGWAIFPWPTGTQLGRRCSSSRSTTSSRADSTGSTATGCWATPTRPSPRPPNGTASIPRRRWSSSSRSSRSALVPRIRASWS